MPGLLGLASLGGKKSRKLKELQPTLAEVMNADEDGNTPMHHACEQNEVETAKQIIERVRTMNDGETKLKQLLLLKNHDGETPIMLALDAAGDSDTGDSSLKLLLGGICLQLKMLPEMFSSSSASEADGIWNRPGFKLPEMGALLVATDKGSLIDDDGNELVGEGEPYVEFLNEYAELPHEGIGLIVAKAFLEEFDEATGWKRSTPWKQASGTYHTPSRLGGAFARVCELAQDAAEAATMCEADYRISEAEKYKELSARVQVAASTCMDYLGNNVAFAICCSVEGDRALNLACQTDQVDLLCTKAMNGIMLRKWRGKRLHERLEATANESNLEWFFNWLYFVFLVAANVAILPLAAATPPLSKYRDYGWAALFPPGGYLLQTAFFQALAGHRPPHLQLHLPPSGGLVLLGARLVGGGRPLLRAPPGPRAADDALRPIVRRRDQIVRPSGPIQPPRPRRVVDGGIRLLLHDDPDAPRHRRRHRRRAGADGGGGGAFRGL